MPAKLKGNKTVIREIRLREVEAPIIATMYEGGINLRVKGARKRITISWYEIALNAHTPDDIPSYLAGRPMDLLCYQTKKLRKAENSQK
jgi:hypothetical protein